MLSYPQKGGDLMTLPHWKRLNGCLRPARNPVTSKEWLEKRLFKFWTQKTPDKIKQTGELWGHGQLQIMLDDGEWRGRIRNCDPSRTTVQKNGKNGISSVTILVRLYWFAHKKVVIREDAHLIPRSIAEWDEIIFPYELSLTLTEVQQTKTKPRRLYFKTVEGHTGYFALRGDRGNITLRHGKVHDPTLT